jgi:inosine-uridine nucleoside N-ribohydrolase
VLDTDIGSDIDDAFAVAMIMQSKQLDLKGVTTVTGDAQARARIVAKMLTLGGMGSVPVAAGASDPKPAFAQARWAEGFNGADLVSQPAVQLLKQAIDKEHGRMVVIAIGPLTNIAALLEQMPDARKKIREIVLMGGSIARGYTPGSGPTPEYNIAEDAGAAQAVFASGIPIRMAPLDVTARLQMDEPHRQQIFALHTPVTDALEALYQLWGQPTPTLHDPMAVSVLMDPSLCQTKRMHVDIEKNGMTRAGQKGSPNATVALETDPAQFINYYVSLFTSPTRTSQSRNSSAAEESSY